MEKLGDPLVNHGIKKNTIFSIHQMLMREIQGRERQFTSIQNHGERLLTENHPAKPCITVSTVAHIVKPPL